MMICSVCLLGLRSVARRIAARSALIKKTTKILNSIINLIFSHHQDSLLVKLLEVLVDEQVAPTRK